MDITPEHKVLDLLQHLGVYLGGVLAVSGAIITFWWHDRRTTKNLIDRNHRENQAEHAEIIKTMHDQHVETIQKMLDLHSK